MNECCMMPGNAKITQSSNPSIAWRVICDWCGLTIYERSVDA